MSSAAPAREVIPPEMDQHRIAWLMTAWLTTEDGPGWATVTKVRFATDGEKIYMSLREGSVALLQIRSQPQVRLSLGKGNQRVKGPEISGLASLIPAGETFWARHLLARKYWRLRLPFSWNRQSVLIEITLT